MKSVSGPNSDYQAASEVQQRKGGLFISFIFQVVGTVGQVFQSGQKKILLIIWDILSIKRNPEITSVLVILGPSMVSMDKIYQKNALWKHIYAISSWKCSENMHMRPAWEWKLNNMLDYNLEIKYVFQVGPAFLKIHFVTDDNFWGGQVGTS